jgi:flagellar basal-body rod modification protein FlgD
MTTIQDNSVSPSLLKTMNPTASASSADGTAGTQDRFLKLLVTQMKNQDPLNPLDNAQVTSQLAQLSTVTGIDKVNTTLQSLMTSMQSGQSLQATSMIGHSVMAPGAGLELAAGKGVFGVDLAAAADKVEVTIKDANGKAVRKMDLGNLPAGMQAQVWDGTTDAGVAAADGQYTFEVSAVAGGQPATATALALGHVLSVSTGPQGVLLNVQNAGSVAMADIRQIL